MVSPGGASRHPARDHLRAARERGAEFVLLSPLREDLPGFISAEWLAIIPGTDVAVMLALAHTLVSESLHDRAFLARYCVGYERFEAYVLGATDGCAKTPEWAERLSEIPAATIRALARRMAAKRTMINVNYSLQRVEHGEQAPWLAVTLAAMLGQIGVPGGGFGQGYGSLGYIGRAPLRVGPPTLAQGRNPVTAFIPFARVADMLLGPGEPFDFDGQRLTYPDVRLVYWCGGNPFHHHQDLARLRRAFARPATMTLERNDIGGSPNDACLVAMRQAIEPWGQARSDFAIFADLAKALGVGERFTEGRDERAWLRHLYDQWRARVVDDGGSAPAFDEFWEAGFLELGGVDDGLVLL